MTPRPRRLLAAAVAVLGVAVALGVAFGACNGPGSPNGGRNGAATSSTVPAGGGGPGLPVGTVRLGVPEEPASLDPFDPKSRTAAGEALLGQVLPQLFRVDPGGREQGWLADDASVRAAADGSSATFALRPGARWSDGEPITADDLRFSLETVRSDVWPGPRAGYDRLTAVEGTGGSVTFRFDGPFPGWRRLFSGADFVLPAHRLRGRDPRVEWKQGPDVSGGPFRLGTITPGLSVVLERNESWWGAKAKAAAIAVLVVPDVRTMEQLLARKELDVAWPPVTSNRIGRFRAVAGVDVSVAVPGGALEALVANTATLPVDRRLAYLGLANRDRFVDVLLAGEADRAVSLTGLAAPASGGAATWAIAGVDPGAGRLKGAALSTLVAATEDELSPLLGRVLQSGAQADGATVELKSDESTTVDGTWLPDGRFDLALVRTVAWPEPCWSCWFAEGSTGRGNVTRVKGLTTLAEAADRDPAAVSALETRVRAEGLMLPLWRPRAVLAGRGVGGLAANSWSLGPFWS
ncbi:MAG TPA: ABC transporter substrate-binding protein, partial [Acidimicrobiia bacterium]|nr:ABC transporter substrate-binding protein [Acidimicrobiia bacterium]